MTVTQQAAYDTLVVNPLTATARDFINASTPETEFATLETWLEFTVKDVEDDEDSNKVVQRVVNRIYSDMAIWKSAIQGI